MEGLTPRLIRAWLRVVIFVLFASASFLTSHVVQAQTVTPGPDGSATISTGGGTIVLPPLTNSGGSQGGTGTGNTGGQTGTPGTQGGSLEGGARAEATLENSASIEDQPATQVNEYCWQGPGTILNCIVVSFLGGMTAAAGSAFDKSISFFIIGFGDLYLNSGLGNSVEGLWETVRDIFNLTFIFGLVYIGFQIILGVNESGARRTIPFLVIAALLVNFSLFITKFIIDFANLAAAQIYSLFTVTGADAINSSAGDGLAGAFLADNGTSIALGFLNQLGVSALLNYQVSDSSPIMYLFGVGVVFIVMIYVFLIGAVLVTIRFAILIFYIIFSPVMFLGWVFPGFKSTTDKFWAGLFGQAFFAPAFLFMLYVTYTLTVNFNADGRKSLQQLGGANANPNTAQNFAEILPYFILIVIFLLGSLSIARKMANAGSSGVMKINDWATGKMRGALVGAGVGGAGYLGYKALDKTAASDSKLVRYTGLGSLSRGISKYTGVRDTAEKAYKSSYIGTSVAAREKRTGELDTRISSAEEKRQSKKEESQASKTASELESLRNVVGPLSTAQQTRLVELEAIEAKYQNNVSSMIKSDIEDMSETDLVSRASLFTGDQMKKIDESDKIKPTAKQKIRSIRENAALAKVTIGAGAAQRVDGVKVSKLSVTELNSLGYSWVLKNSHFLTNGQFDKIKDGGMQLSDPQKDRLGQQRSQKFASIATTGTTLDFQDIMKGRKADDLTKMPKELFINPLALPHLSEEVLRGLTPKLNTSEKNVIRTYVGQNHNLSGFFGTAYATNNGWQ
ncbi:MAG: hypothetical protein RLZZ70_587 [Candidatus Parcubacteria bacterium]